MRFNKNNITAYLLMTVLAFIFAACLMESGGFDPGEKEDENKPDESIKSGIFTTAPVFAFAEEIPGSTGLADYIQYRFTAAAPVDGVVYALFIAEGQFNKRDDIITRGDLVTGKQPDTTYTYGPVKAGVLYSSVVVAKSGTDEAISAVQQSLGFSPLGFEEGTGTLKSAGRATQPGQRTFYIDYENGNDSNTGQSPAAAWKTFAKANNTVFRPGDRILLEADSVWNGTPTVGASAGSKPAPYPQSSNFAQFRDQRGNGGMLAPRGNGTADNPIIIDLYDYDKAAGKVYFSANHRPIINGNGTPMLFREDNSISYYDITGAIHLQDVDFWQVRNIETTNSFDFPYIADDPWLRETHIFKRTVFKDLGGIVILGKLPWQQTRAKGMLVEYCYIHDVQQLNRNNNNVYGRYTSKEYIGESWQGKTGALYVVFTESTAQHNIIKNVGLEGMCAQGATGSNVVIRGNYIENVGGDGIVMCQVYDSIVESNICKNVNSAPNLGSANYAGNWCYESRRLLYQYNETYGLLYGNLDGEAWDVDDSSTNVIYQYNYSHHNSGGVCLFMGSQQNSIFRYNISVNDGGGPKYLNSVSDYHMTKYQAYFAGAMGDNSQHNNYVWDSYNRGQSLFHYAFAGTSGNQIPLIHNNTFYIGEGYEVSLFGHTSSSTTLNKGVKFVNNIVIKDGPENVRLTDGHNPGGSNQYSTGRFQGTLRNNIFWAPSQSQFVSNPANQITDIVTNTPSGSNQPALSGNMWADPRLRIQSMPAETVPVHTPGTVSGTNDARIKTEPRRQLNEAFPEDSFNDPKKLIDFVSVGRLRMRAQYFTPEAGSPAIEAGYAIPVGTVSAINNAQNFHIGNNGTVTPGAGFRNPDQLTDYPTQWSASGGITADFFGNPVDPARPPIGAAAGPVIISVP